MMSFRSRPSGQVLPIRPGLHGPVAATSFRYLTSAQNKLTPEERADVVPLFESWAERTGSESIYVPLPKDAGFRDPCGLS